MSSSAARRLAVRGAVARHRARERAGRALYETEHDVVTLEEMLRAAGLLGPDEDDHDKVEAALQRFIDTAIRDHEADVL